MKNRAGAIMTQAFENRMLRRAFRPRTLPDRFGLIAVDISN